MLKAVLSDRNAVGDASITTACPSLANTNLSAKTINLRRGPTSYQPHRP